MNKKEFLIELRKGMLGLPQDDIEERLMFYSEMIDDLMEEVFSEKNAVSKIGNIDEIISHIVEDIPFSKLVKQKITPKRQLKVWEIVFLILGSPIWISLLIAVFSIVISLYASLWSVIITLWATFVSIEACTLSFVVVGIGMTLGINKLTGIAIISLGIILAGVSIFLFFGCKIATKGILLLTKKIVSGIKNYFIKKEEL